MATEKRLIDANKAQAVLVNMAEHLMEAGNPEMAGAVGYAADVIGKQKTVDAVEVVHGRWLFDSGSGKYFCSACDENALSFKKDTFGFGEVREVCLSDYCPSCGAKMDGDKNG